MEGLRGCVNIAANILVICGPTASGKTKLSLALCKALDGEVVSADSMQVYRGMDIGTAKPSAQEQEGIPHHMLSVADPRENYSVARYVKEASACVDDILARGKLPIVVGGTGLYIESLCRGQDFAGAEISGGYRDKLQQEAELLGAPALWERLRGLDPETAERLHPNDAKRIIRALEVYLETGKPLSQLNRETRPSAPRYERTLIGLTYEDRDDLRARINLRVDEMMAAGLLQEVQALKAAGIPRESTAMQAIGYKEILRAMDEGVPLGEAVEEIKLRSRQYAKRQLTWFRHLPDINWIVWEKTPDFSTALQNSISFLRKKD